MPKTAPNCGSAMLREVSDSIPVKLPKYKPIIVRYGCGTSQRALVKS